MFDAKFEEVGFEGAAGDERETVIGALIEASADALAIERQLKAWGGFGAFASGLAIPATN